MTVRPLASRQCGPGSILVRCHTWVEFILWLLFAPEVFVRVISITVSVWNSMLDHVTEIVIIKITNNFRIKRDFLKHKTVKTNDKIRRFGVVMTPLSRKI